MLVAGRYYCCLLALVWFRKVEHVKNEVSLLSMIAHPAIVNM